MVEAGELELGAYLTSANLEGSSTVMAPPNSGVFLYLLLMTIICGNV
jgi:hypothetical protein